MKLFRRFGLLFFTLTLILSLDSFSVVTTQQLPQIFNIELVVKPKYSKSFSVDFEKAKQHEIIPFLRYYGTSFCSFISYYNLLDMTSYKVNFHNTQIVLTYQLQYQNYSPIRLKTLYEYNII